MSTHKDRSGPADRDYEVGYAKTPEGTRFKKGQSGNPKGRPRKKPADTVDITALLEEPLKVTTGGSERLMSQFEVSTRALAKRALEGDLNTIITFIRLCEEYQIISPPPPVSGGGVIVAPKGVDFYEWVESVTEEVPVE
jgi:hypothetical protein